MKHNKTLEEVGRIVDGLLFEKEMTFEDDVIVMDVHPYGAGLITLRPIPGIEYESRGPTMSGEIFKAEIERYGLTVDLTYFEKDPA